MEIYPHFFRRNHFYDVKSIVPPKREQDDIVKYINEIELEIDDLIQNIKNEIDKLKEYKTSLIDSVVTGKVRVVKWHMFLDYF